MLAILMRLAEQAAAFLHPTYHPERHYMRGPGPPGAGSWLPERLISKALQGSRIVRWSAF